MRKMKNKILVGSLPLLIVTLLIWEGQAHSQEAYPTKPIEIIVTSAAGGSTDLLNRTVASFLSKKWGVPVNVVNKTGGNSIPGILAVYNANPDGYTMLGEQNAISSMFGASLKNLPFKTLDRTFVSKTGASPQLFMVAANSPLKNLKDLATEAKRDPKNFTWTINGAGNDSGGFALRQFFKEIDVDPQKTKPISITGGGQGVIMVGGGHAIMGCPSLSSAVASIKGGTVRGLAITSKNRYPDWPDLPTTAESGYPNVNIEWWGGISGPPKLPAFIVEKWEKALEEILKDPQVIAKMREIALTPTYLNSKSTRELVVNEIDEYSKLWGSIKSGE